MSPGQQEIPVFVRVRPLNTREREAGGEEVWVYDERRIASSMKGREQREPFAVNRVFNTESCNEELFRRCAKDIVAHALKGWSGTVFAYGQTASGKTHTMIGDEKDPGIVRRSVGYIWEEIEKDDEADYIVRCTSLEVYNEKLTDLRTSKELDIVQEPKKDPYLRGDEPVVVSSSSHAYEVIDAAMNNRHVGKTNMNERSSRSHTIFRIQIDRMPKSDSTSTTRSLLNLVDLAGSESMKKTGTTGAAAREGSNINQSLSALVRVIRALTEIKPTKTGKPSNVYIPFRDSKLTHLLKTSLGGNTKTGVICCVTGSSDQYDQTLSTLRFAQVAAKVKNDPKRGVLRDGEIPLALRRTVQAMVAAQSDEAKEAHRKEVAGLLEEVEREKTEKLKQLEAMESALAAEREKRKAAESALYQQGQREAKPAAQPNRRQTMMPGGFGNAPPLPKARLSVGFGGGGGPAPTALLGRLSTGASMLGGGGYGTVPKGATELAPVDVALSVASLEAMAKSVGSAAHEEEKREIEEITRQRDEALAQRERDATASCEEIAALKAALKAKEVALAASESDAAAKAAALAASESDAAAKAAELAAQREAKGSLAEQFASYKTRHEASAADAAAAAAAQREELAGEVAAYKAKHEAAEARLAVLAEAAAAAAAEVAAEGERKAALEAQLREVEGENVASADRVAQLEAQLLEVAQRAQAIIQETQETKEERDRFAAEKEAAAAAKESLEKALHEEQQAKLSIEMEKHRLAQELSETADRLHKQSITANEYETAKREACEINTKLHEYMRKNEELAEDKSRLETEGAESFKKAWNAERDAEVERVAFEAQRAKLVEECEAMKSEIEAKEARHAQQLQQLEEDKERKALDHQSKVEAMKDEHRKDVARLNEEKEQQLAAFEDEKTELQERFETRVADQEKEKAAAESELLKALQEAKESAQVERKLLEQNFDEQRVDLEAKLAAEEAAHAARLQEMEARAASAEAQKEEKERHLRAVEAMNQEIKEAHDEKVRDVEALSRKAEEEQAAHEARMVALQEEKEKAIAALEAERAAEIAQLQEAAAGVAQGAKENEARLMKEWEEELEKEQLKYSSERSVFEAEISALQGDAEKQQHEHRELEKNYTQQVSSLNKQFAERQQLLRDEAEREQRHILRRKQELEVENQMLGKLTREQKEELDCSMLGPMREAYRELEKKYAAQKAKLAKEVEEKKQLEKKVKVLEADKDALKRQLEVGGRGRGAFAMKPAGKAGVQRGASAPARPPAGGQKRKAPGATTDAAEKRAKRHV